MKTAHKARIFPLITCLCLLLGTVFVSGQKDFTPVSAAASDIQTAYEQQNVLDDLKGSEFGGEAFDLKEYPRSTQGDPKVLSLVEFCYNYYAEENDDYALYLIIYNPRQLDFTDAEVRNTIQMSVGSSTVEHNYSLKIINKSVEPGTERLFYKFKINLDAEERENVLSALSGDRREYRITDLQLKMSDGTGVHALQKTENKPGIKFTYTGYAEGYGSFTQENAPLSCTVDGLEKLVSLDLHHTYYRTQGNFYKGEQDQLNSVFFRIPRKYTEDYGELSAVLCEFYEYFTKPVLVTNDLDIYNTFKNNVTNLVSTGKHRNKFIAGKFKTDDINMGSWFQAHKTESRYILNEAFDVMYNEGYMEEAGAGETVTRSYENFLKESTVLNELAGICYTTAGDLTNYSISSYNLTKELQRCSTYSGHSFPEGYDYRLFEDYVYPTDTYGKNSKEVTPDIDYPLNWNYTAQAWWQKVFTGGYSVTTEHADIKAFEFIDDESLKGESKEIADRIYIDELDVNLLREEYQKAQKNDEILVLLRFGLSAYYSFPGYISTIEYPESNYGYQLINDVNNNYSNSKWNSFIFQETVYLNFDVLSMTFTRNGVKTVIPVSAAPQDIINAGTAPLQPSDSVGSGCNSGKLATTIVVVVAVILAVLLIVLLWPVMPQILKGLLWIILLPFKLIKMLIDAISDAVKRRREEKERKRAEKEAEARRAAEAERAQARSSHAKRKKYNTYPNKKPYAGKTTKKPSKKPRKKR